MNIAILQEHIDTFTREVIDSGFKRDIDDYIASLQAMQSNIVGLREIANKVLSTLDSIYAGDLPNCLQILLPKKPTIPFTIAAHHQALRKIVQNTEIPQGDFFNQLTQFLNALQGQIQQNITDVANITTFITPYISKDAQVIAENNLAIVSIVFKEHHTITNLQQFTKSLALWNRTLPLLHQLVKSEPPQDIQIVEVQNGSIDFVVNLNLDVALDLVELFKVGFEVFGAYLSYKKIIKPIVDSYHGNKELTDQEKSRDKLLLGNIGLAITKRLERQHSEAIKTDKKIDKTALKTKYEQVTNLVTSHIVKGNDLKLIAIPKTNGSEEEEKKSSAKKEDLRKLSMSARLQLQDIPLEDQKVLLEEYGKILMEEKKDTSKKETT